MKSVLSIQSHVVFGCAGNSAAVFPMRRLGMDVWPINTVQFSNHTQYAQGWQGMAMPAGHISALVKGLGNIEALSGCGAVLSGYLGSAEQGDEILTVVNAVKAANPDAIYFCDPVMGHPEKGCIVAPGVTRFLTEQALPVADMMAPNLLELETLCDTHLADLDQTRAAPGNQHVHIPVQVHQLIGGFVAGILHQRDTVGGKTGLDQDTPHELCGAAVGADGLLAAPEDAHVAGFEA